VKAKVVFSVLTHCKKRNQILLNMQPILLYPQQPEPHNIRIEGALARIDRQKETLHQAQ
jgi:hypothetical protein